MSEQIEQLKADKAALEAAKKVAERHGWVRGNSWDYIMMDLDGKIARAEKQAADPWKEAKQLAEGYKAVPVWGE
jgi:hypothetical protein